jgi:hypothetical protein
MTRVVQKQHQSPAAIPATRRQVIASMLAGGAFAAVAPGMLGRASAASVDVPKRDARDNPVLNAAMNREAQMVATYAIAVANTSGADDKAALLLIHDHHVAYVDALRGFLATEVEEPTGGALANPTGAFASVAAQLAELEDQTVSIHVANLNTIVGMDAATLVASIIPMEARHGAALAVVSGQSPTAAARV